MSRVELAKIRSLTFYKEEVTAARRTSALSQLQCIGQPCNLYQPDVVRCVNAGGEGVDIDWKCEADLPEALRFGKVKVSCEGWSRPGDPYVLKGSCALEYRLVQVPDALRTGKTDYPVFGSWTNQVYETSTIVFWVLWISVLFIILYSILKSCINNGPVRVQQGAHNRPGPDGGTGGGFGRRWFPGDHRDDYYNPPPPPPYSKTPPTPGSGWEGWRPGFWTGAAMGGLANHVWNRNRAQVEPERIRRVPWNWEQRWMPFSSDEPAYRPRPMSRFDDNDRGEGTSSLGAMRSSTGFGGTNVR